MMKTENTLLEDSTNKEENKQPLASMNQLQSYLTKEEELAFMNILYSSSATLRAGNFGLRREVVEEMLQIKNDDEKFYSFINRVNQGLSRYYRLIYDEKRDQVVAMMRVTSKMAKTTLSPEALAILLLMFYQQEVIQHPFTLLSQIFDAFGHEQLRASHLIKTNINILKRIGAVEEIEAESDEEAYQITAIGANMFSDSFLRRTIEFSQSRPFNKEEVLKFFKRYNLQSTEAGDDE